jgi:hypothetical protein
MVAAVCLAAACFPTTTRPHTAEIELFVPAATRALAVALDTDSLPVSRTEPDDGWLETPWFDAATLQPTTARVVGTDVVKIRAFVEPGRANHSIITIEAVYRPLLDPSRDGRELERHLAAEHPVALRVKATMERLQAEYGG